MSDNLPGVASLTDDRSESPLHIDGEAITGTIARLRTVLAGSGEFPRPIAHNVLPASMLALAEKQIAKFRPSAVLVAVMLDRAPARVLLTVRSENLRQHKGQISFPGGRRDDTDDSYAAAALREADEEVGLPPASVEVIGYLEDVPTLTGYRITPVVGLVHDGFEAKPHAGEVAEIVELPLEQVLLGERFQRKPLERFGVTYPTHELQYGRHRIWGATAAILWNLRLKFHGES